MKGKIVKAYYFRVLKNDGSFDPANHCAGVVFGETKEDIFWAIDEFTDPYLVELRKAYTGGIYYSSSGLDDDTNIEICKCSENTWIEEGVKWQKPKWGRI